MTAPSAIARSATESAIAAALRSGSHPFLAFGRTEEVEVARPAGITRLIASVDSRQAGPDGPIGSIGFLEVDADTMAFDRALDAADRWLRGLGVVDVRCPVNLSTWYGHRTIVESFPELGGAPPFPLEPSGAPWLPARLAANGFRPDSRGVATLVPNDRAIAATAPSLERALDAGYRDRPIEPRSAAAELDLLHGLSSTIFATAAGFSPISREEFHALYGPLVDIVDPALVRIMEDPAGEPVGFVFAVTDRGGPHSYASAAQFVLKTIGVLPAARRAFPGLGWAMVSRVHALAEERGFGVGIHAVAAESSYSARFSARWGTRIRRYASFRRTT